MKDTPNNETRVRLLDAAEALFSSRGYTSVRLRDIAAAVDMRHASLYYYAPGGKAQLYIEVMERSMQRHRIGLEAAIRNAGGDLRAEIYAVVDWLVAQPPLDINRMNNADMHELNAEQARKLMELSYDSLRLPIGEALARAAAAGQITVPDVDLAAMGLIALIQSVHAIPPAYRSVSLAALGHQLAAMLMDGWFRR
ncbi:TetR/AcrR family transcriptional regulator [Candidatus Gracilibacteria bacterium]|nr:TetR/AcrR family transcriptional regulator [Candidatus Gracilibacteria bacterium]